MAATKSRQRRYEIAAAAVGLFIDRGYANVTTDDIADAVGIGARTFFRHFATKEDAAFPDHEERVARFVEALRQRRGSRDPVEAVFHVTAMSVREYFDEPGLYRPRYRLVRAEAALRNHERIANAVYESAIVSFLIDELGDEPRSRLSAHALAAALVSGVDVILDEWASDPGSDPEAGLTELHTVIAGFASSLHGSATSDVIVMVDDPELRRDLARVVEAHRRTTPSSDSGTS